MGTQRRLEGPKRVGLILNDVIHPRGSRSHTLPRSGNIAPAARASPSALAAVPSTSVSEEDQLGTVAVTNPAPRIGRCALNLSIGYVKLSSFERQRRRDHGLRHIDDPPAAVTAAADVCLNFGVSHRATACYLLTDRDRARGDGSDGQYPVGFG